MLKQRLGDSELYVSPLCLGTMTWGEQNSEAEAHQQIDIATTAGINFFDTAEMYPVPPKADTQGITESHIGSWLKKNRQRDDIIIASKVAGPAPWLDYFRPEMNSDYGPKFDRQNIRSALEGSLKRLGTDYIDLYQLHWPDRNTNYFGKLGYQHNDNETHTPLFETLSVLSELVDEGKIRYIGISNETPWGLMSLLSLAQQKQLPKVVSIQNPYNLLNRSFEVGLAECAIRENVPLLAYSPLAFGVLSGKYLHGARPAGARLSLFDRFIRYSGNEADDAVIQYLALAEENNLSPVQMALAFVQQQRFAGSTIIGATSTEQLKENIASSALMLPPELIASIEKIHQAHPNPCP